MQDKINVFSLNDAQREILQIFAGGMSDEQFLEFKRILLEFKFKRLTQLADEFVDARGWTSEDIAQDAKKIKRRPQIQSIQA